MLSVEGKAGTDLDAICSCFAAWSTWCTLWVVTGALALILVVLHSARKWLLRKFEWLKTFYVWIGVLAVLGGAWAFLFPLAINADFSKNGDGAALRQTLIYTTGGLLGVITLGETRHKNDQEHMRQVHAERRSRYATAIEQLADEKAPIRLGGVYTLVKLVDDWLADKKTLPSEKERRQEGQIIIDSLCAYIRSSFLLAERYDELTLSYEEYQQNRQGNQDLHSPQVIPLPKPKNAKQSREEFVRDKSLFQEEQEVRKTILLEIKNRLNGGTTKNKDGRDEIKPGTWSYFEYDFSNAVFFYDVNFNEVNFSGKKTSFLETKFTQKAEFSGSIFNEITDFSEAQFHEGTTFSETHFSKKVDFSRTHFSEDTDFFEAEFTGKADFFEAEFTGNANFFWAKFTGKADFSKAKFTEAYFSEAKFTEANFSKAKFTKTHFFEAKFTESHFSMAEFTEDTDFSMAEFTGNANFSWAKFTKKANFSWAKFTEAHFSKAKFTEDTDFSMAEFTGNADFSMAEFTGNANFFWAKFTKKANFSKAKFTEDTDFSEAEFTKNADFSEAEFTKNADFSKAKFTKASFSGATFEEKPQFERALGDKTCKARFSCKADPEDYNFEVSHNSRYKIETKEKEYNGAKFIIPKGAELFDPDEPSEQDNNDGN